MKTSDAIRAAGASHRGDLAQVTRRAAIIVVVVLLAVLVVVAGIAIDARRVAGNAAEEAARQITPAVVAQITPEIVRQLIAESRGQRAVDGRSELARWNAVLASRSLPTIEAPPPDATADQILGAWVTARVYATLPELVADDVREGVADGQVPAVLPSSTTTDDDSSGGPTLVPLPGLPASSSSPVPAPTGPVPSAPPPASGGTSGGGGGDSDDGLLPLLPRFPVPVPLLTR